MTFTRADWTCFRTLSGLAQKAGVPERLLPCVVVKVDSGVVLRLKVKFHYMPFNGDRTPDTVPSVNFRKDLPYRFRMMSVACVTRSLAS